MVWNVELFFSQEVGERQQESWYNTWYEAGKKFKRYLDGGKTTKEVGAILSNMKMATR